MQPVACELHLRYEHTFNCLLCTASLVQCNNCTTVASNKWLGVIKIIAQVILGQQFLHNFGC